MIKFVVILAVASVAVAIALWANRARSTKPVESRREHTVPAQLDRADFVNRSSPWLLVLFSSATCQACAEILTTIGSYEGPNVAVQDVEFLRDRELHDRYGIDTVPTTVLVDVHGAVRAHWLGPIDHAELVSMLDSNDMP